MTRTLSIWILILALVILCWGLAVVFTATSTISEIKFGSAYKLFTMHAIKALLGIAVMFAFALTPYTIYKRLAKPGIIAACILLLLTIIFAPSVKGAERWINLGLFSFQPTDVAKLALIIYLAELINRKAEFMEDLKKGYLVGLGWIALVAGLVFAQPNISNGLLIVVISLTILYIGGARLKHILLTGVIGGFSIASLAMILPHSRVRIISFINGVNTGKDINIQVKQALYALGSGGINGAGIGASKQNNLFLPEAYGDFIFAILGEEYGFIGTVVLATLYLAIFIFGLLLAKKVKDQFGQLIAFGVSFLILVYAFVNMAVTTGLFPTTGLPLPLVSYGGTSIIFVCSAIGILINIGFRNASDEPETIFPKKPVLAKVNAR